MNNTRNIIRLKDIPSNAIEEAIIIFKQNKKAKKYESSSNKFINQRNDEEDENKYIVKEAEMVISQYLNSGKDKESILLKKIKNQRIVAIFLGVLLLLSIIL